MYAFTYSHPENLNAAVAELANDEAKALAGGMTLLPTMKQRLASPGAIVDLGGLKELSGVSRDGDAIVIGAMTRHIDVANSKDVKSAIPALAYLAGEIGDPAVRNRGTIGGSLANNDPAADYPAAALALGATIVTNKRSLTADAFLQGPVRDRARAGRAHHQGPLPGSREGGLREVPQPGLALCAGRRVRREVGGGRARRRDGRRLGTACSACRPSSRRWPRISRPPRSNGLKVDASDLASDLHADSDYRAHLIGVMAKRAVTAAG